MQLRTAAKVIGVRLGAKAAPISVSFEVTHRCNLACNYCDRHTARAEEMSTDAAMSTLDQLCDLGMRTISLDGGEPLTHPAVHAFVSRLVNRGVSVNMNSNGILVPDKLETVRRVAKLKVSLDGPQAVHDATRGRKAYVRAIRGIIAARSVGVPVELTCVVGIHNAHVVDELIELAAQLGLRIVFQPERSGLFNEASHATVAGVPEIHRAFERIEAHKRSGRVVANRWSSLRHFRSFPKDTSIPCAAGRINATLDPCGMLYACGQTPRVDAGVSVLDKGVRAAFEQLDRSGCKQCWCARVVEENLAWGCRFDQLLPPSRGLSRPSGRSSLGANAPCSNA